MRAPTILICFAALLCFAVLATEAFALTGNEWKQLSPSLREVYVWGVVDTWILFAPKEALAAEPFAEESLIFRLLSGIADRVACMSGKMTRGQISAIVEKYMEENPAQWHQPMSALIWHAVDRACTASHSSTGPKAVKEQRK